jgi:RNA recognition motif-containing protein
VRSCPQANGSPDGPRASVQGSAREGQRGRRHAIAARIFVGNLNYQTTRDELAALLAPAGQIVAMSLPTDRETGRPRGFAFVEFMSEAEASEAIRLFNARELGGRKLTINMADDRRRAEGPRPPRVFEGPPPDSVGGGYPFGGGLRGAPHGKPFKAKGSRRGLRARKRSL